MRLNGINHKIDKPRAVTFTHTHTQMIGGIFRNKDQERLDIVPQAAQCVKNYGVMA